MTDKKVKKDLPIMFQKLKEYDVNDVRFMSVRIWILHTGLNYNGSIFTKEVVEKNLHTLSNTPVLAFIEENSQGEIDFSDHRMILERKSDGEIGVRYLGQAIGVIPESHNAHWEFRVGDDGVEREYLVCDALIWKKWDDPVDIFNREQKTWQSMELSEKYSGYWDEEGNFVFETFEFNGACLLSNIDTLPAMNNSTAELIYTKSTTEKVFAEIKDKLEMFNREFSNTDQKEGGNNVSDVIQKNVEQQEEKKVVEDVKKQDSEAVEHVQDKVEENVEKQQEKVDEQEVVVEEQFDYKTKYEKVREELDQLKSSYSKLEEEVNELRNFKSSKLAEERSAAEQEIFNKFSSELTEDEINTVKESSSKFSLEELEEKLFTLVGKKKVNFSKQPKKEKQSTTVKISLDQVKDDDYSPYGGIFEKYSK